MKFKAIITPLLVLLGVTCSVAFGITNRYIPASYNGLQDTTKVEKRAILDSIVDSTKIEKKLSSLVADSTHSTLILTDSLLFDSTAIADSLLNDSIRPPKKPFLDAPIKGTSNDSLVYDVKDKQIYIFKEGVINYQDMSIKADYIQMGTESKLVHAEGMVLDTVTKKPTRPEFKQGEQLFTADSMNYNMETGKALIKGVDTKDGDGIVKGGTAKKMKDNTIHMHNGRYTVCDAECPHFYLQMTKGTMIQDKVTVFGYSYMVFEDVPLYPLMVPFGFFPSTRTRKSGILFPEFGEEQIKGFFIRNGGYYFAINDYVDFRVVGGIYTLGSWQVGAASNYAWKYKFSGNIGFDYAADKIGQKGDPNYLDATNISIRWTHSQDPKFMPGSTFSASVNYTSSTYNKFNAQNMQDYLNSQTTSSINYSKSWAGLPLSLSVNASMSQNSRDSSITMNLPSVNFNVTRIAPFKRKNPIGKERWYEKISFTYNFEFKNDVNNIKEKELFNKAMFDKMKMGMKHTIPISASFNILQYLNVSPSFNYNERWYFRKINQHWDQENNRNYSDTTRGFYRVFDYSANISLNTKLYGTYTVGTKKKSIFRHVFTPSVGFSYSPDNGARYWQKVQKDATGQLSDYSPFSQEMYGVPNRGQTAGISFGLNNSIEAKFPSDKDSTGFKKVKLIEQFNISGGYNFLADSMQLSPFAVNLSTNIANKLPLNFTASFDPYALDANGNRINKFLVSEGKFLRMTSLAFSLGYSFQGGNKTAGSGTPAKNNQLNNDNFKKQTELTAMDNFFSQQEEKKPSPKELALLAATQYYDFSIPWSFGFNYSFQYTNTTNKPTVNQTVNFNANVNLTSKWAISASAGYDFTMGKLTPGTISITRDLHCWQMSFQWVPVGFRQSWSFHIAVKASTLSDLLKWEKNNSFYDNNYNNRR